MLTLEVVEEVERGRKSQLHPHITTEIENFSHAREFEVLWADEKNRKKKLKIIF